MVEGGLPRGPDTGAPRPARSEEGMSLLRSERGSMNKKTNEMEEIPISLVFSMDNVYLCLSLFC